MPTSARHGHPPPPPLTDRMPLRLPLVCRQANLHRDPRLGRCLLQALPQHQHHGCHAGLPAGRWHEPGCCREGAGPEGWQGARVPHTSVLLQGWHWRARQGLLRVSSACKCARSAGAAAVRASRSHLSAVAAARDEQCSAGGARRVCDLRVPGAPLGAAGCRSSAGGWAPCSETYAVAWANGWLKGAFE